MFKILFWLKKSDVDQGSLEHITIDSPKVDKTVEVEWGNRYVCEVYLSVSELKKNLIYGVNPIDTLCLASEFTRVYLQGLIKRGYTISEVESKKPWILEKLNDNFIQEKWKAIKNNPNISESDKDKILAIIKESFSKTVIKDELEKLR